MAPTVVDDTLTALVAVSINYCMLHLPDVLVYLDALVVKTKPIDPHPLRAAWCGILGSTT